MTKQQQVIYLNIIKAIYDTSTANTIFNVVVRSLRRVQLFATPWTVACQASLSITNSQSLLKLMSIESVMPTNYLILCHPLLFLPSIFPTSGSFPMSQCPNNLSFRISPSNDYSGLISSVQGTLKSLLQHHSSKASIIQHSAFFMVQLSYPYMTARKTIALTIQTFVGKGLSLPCNVLCRH